MKRLAVALVALPLLGCASHALTSKIQRVEDMTSYLRSAQLATVDGVCQLVISYADGSAKRYPVDRVDCDHGRVVTAVEAQRRAATPTPAAAPAPPQGPAAPLAPGAGIGRP